MSSRQAELGNHLRRARDERWMSARALAAAVGVDMAQIVRLEQGAIASPKPDLLARIADTLDIPVADLLALAGYPLTTELPTLAPYLRTKYPNLSSHAVTELTDFFDYLQARYGAHRPAEGDDER